MYVLISQIYRSVGNPLRKKIRSKSEHQHRTPAPNTRLHPLPQQSNNATKRIWVQFPNHHHTTTPSTTTAPPRSAVLDFSSSQSNPPGRRIGLGPASRWCQWIAFPTSAAQHHSRPQPAPRNECSVHATNPAAASRSIPYDSRLPVGCFGRTGHCIPTTPGILSRYQNEFSAARQCVGRIGGVGSVWKSTCVVHHHDQSC